MKLSELDRVLLLVAFLACLGAYEFRQDDVTRALVTAAIGGLLTALRVR